MLSPQARTVAMELLRPPPGLRLDLAVLTTYTLDLEALLALPLAAMAHADGGVEKLLEDPLLLLQALREAGDRIHVFVDETGIAVPRRERELYATLEESVHPVRAPGGGVFHPKVWLARISHQAASRRQKSSWFQEVDRDANDRAGCDCAGRALAGLLAPCAHMLPQP